MASGASSEDSSVNRQTASLPVICYGCVCFYVFLCLCVFFDSQHVPIVLQTCPSYILNICKCRIKSIEHLPKVVTATIALPPKTNTLAALDLPPWPCHPQMILKPMRYVSRRARRDRDNLISNIALFQSSLIRETHLPRLLDCSTKLLHNGQTDSLAQLIKFHV